MRGSALPPAPRLWHTQRHMGRRLDSATTASSAALSRYGYAYAYPFAWRFS